MSVDAMVFGSSVKHSRGQKVGLDHILAVSGVWSFLKTTISLTMLISIRRMRMLFRLLRTNLAGRAGRSGVCSSILTSLERSVNAAHPFSSRESPSIIFDITIVYNSNWRVICLRIAGTTSTSELELSPDLSVPNSCRQPSNLD